MRLLMIILFIDSFCAYVDCCNEAVCSSIVSKCLLTKACNCDLSARVCSKDCFSCLGDLYTECCVCVDMCPKPTETTEDLGKKSHVEDFLENVPELFNVLTEYPDELERWNVVRYPVEINVNPTTGKKEIKIKDGTDERQIAPNDKHSVVLNCTVTFWAQCMSWTKCKSNCFSMGSASYRWFHDGCCQCVGSYCINYGLSESRCTQCPMDENVIDATDEEDLDFGEEDFFDYEEEEEEET